MSWIVEKVRTIDDVLYVLQMVDVSMAHDIDSRLGSSSIIKDRDLFEEIIIETLAYDHKAVVFCSCWRFSPHDTFVVFFPFFAVHARSRRGCLT